MMKRLFGFTMALMLLMSLSAARAEEGVVLTAPELPEEEYIILTEVGMKIWIPASLESEALTAEDREDGYIAYFTGGGGTKAMAIQCFAVGKLTLEEFSEYLMDDNVETEYVTINGLRWLRYPLPENDSMSYAYSDEAVFVLEITFAPMSDAEFAALMETVLSSVQPA